MKNRTKKAFLYLFALWLMGSLIGSYIKQTTTHDYITHKEVSGCNKTYPIDYIFYNNLFCEVENRRERP